MSDKIDDKKYCLTFENLKKINKMLIICLEKLKFIKDWGTDTLFKFLFGV